MYRKDDREKIGSPSMMSSRILSNFFTVISRDIKSQFELNCLATFRR
jgi:hypothetical protein